MDANKSDVKSCSPVWVVGARACDEMRSSEVLPQWWCFWREIYLQTLLAYSGQAIIRHGWIQIPMKETHWFLLLNIVGGLLMSTPGRVRYGQRMFCSALTCTVLIVLGILNRIVLSLSIISCSSVERAQPT